MEVLREFDWGVAAICGGMCSCATCHVYVDQAWQDKFPRREMDEEELLEFLDGFRPGSRLSCQLELREHHDGLQVELAPDEEQASFLIEWNRLSGNGAMQFI